jgi:hypothetical protein|tara:strand:+ start:550 stop:1020 length:471 start_codon:yes stop_codon:yes gene_type:complete
MLELLTPENIKENWKRYKDNLKVAFTSSEGTDFVTGEGSEDIYKVIYNRLINPFSQTMHLWSEGEEDYIVLTQLQESDFTGKRTLVLFSATRTEDVNEETVANRYYEAYQTISKFARDKDCEGMYCYSDLDYFAELAQQTKEWTNVITRYQFLSPI